MVLEKMCDKVKLLRYFRSKLIDSGYINATTGLQSQIQLLDDMIQIEALNVLDELLRKTNYRLLTSIVRGHENVKDILQHPNEWNLGKFDENHDEFTSVDSVIFETERCSLVFSKNNLTNGQTYVNNKWQ